MKDDPISFEEFKALHEEAPAPEQLTNTTQYSEQCKINLTPIGLDSSTEIHFQCFIHASKQESVHEGAILLAVQDFKKDIWLPKKLCSNLDLNAGTVRVWTPFLEDKLPDLC